MEKGTLLVNGFASPAERDSDGVIYSGPDVTARSKRVLTLTISSDLADAIEKYTRTDWSDGRDPSKLGALNAVAYIGEQLVALYLHENVV